jgi:hypothetical protein
MSIEGIFRCPEAGGSMESMSDGTLITGDGLEGDRYCNRVGTYSVFKASKLNIGDQEAGRQLTLISIDDVENVLLKNNVDPLKGGMKDLRRNIGIRGLPKGSLMNSFGRVIRLGRDCKVRILRHCVPCMYNERKNGISGLMETIWNEAGVCCEVLVGGAIIIGDSVTIETIDVKLAQWDDGLHPPSFYVKPSKRSGNDVRESMRKKKEIFLRLSIKDPLGLKRAEESYAAVGIKFWPGN